MTQISVTGTAEVLTDGAVGDANWQTTAASSRRGYLGKLAPGTSTQRPDINLPPEVRGRIPTEDELIPARRNFAVLSIVITSIDWLRLGRDGNLRAVLSYGASTNDFTWVAP